MSTATARRPVLVYAGALVFPVVTFLIATCFHGADLGKYTDDWMLCRRDILTLQIERLTDLDQRGFYRPLSRIVSPIVQTLLWDHDRIIHLILICCHAVNVLLLWRVLLAAGCGTRAALAFALLFALYPAQHEAVFWSSILATSLATAGFTLISWAQIQVARRPESCAIWWATPCMALLAFAVCCLNEQPAMGILALPALSLGVSARARPVSAVRRWCIAILPGFVSGLAVLSYLALMVATAPPGQRADVSQWTPRNELISKAARLADAVADQMLMRDFMRGAAAMGWRSMQDAPWLAAVCLALMLGSAAVFLRWWIGDRLDPARPAPLHLDHRSFRSWCLWLILFGLGVFTLDWLPAWIVHIYTADSRLCYPAAAGLAIAAAAIATTFGAGTSRPAAVRNSLLRQFLPGTIVVIIASAFTLMMVGMQRAYRERAAWESRQFEQLRDVLPDPPERAVFIVVSAPYSTRLLPPTGAGSFDRALMSVWENPWNIRWFLRWKYRRPDVRAVPSEGWPGPAILDIGEEGMYVSRMPANPPARSDKPEGTLVPWRFVVPIAIDPDGHLRLVTQFAVRDNPAGSDLLRIRPPVVVAKRSALAQPDQVPDRSFIFVRGQAPRIFPDAGDAP